MSRVAQSLLADSATSPRAPARLALAAKGFRPFFLLAAGLAAVALPIWLLVLRGAITPGTYLAPAIWHSHEMIFGFATAVIAGFLLTAVSNWTQRETATGAPLLALATLWLGGRVAILIGASLPRGVAATVDLAFLPVLIAVLARPLIAAKSRRNFVMLAILGALFAADVLVHLDALGLVAFGTARRMCLFAVDLIVLMITIVAGRVLPMFTRNATGVTAIRTIPWLDVPSVAAMAVLALLDAFAPESRAVAPASAIAGILAIARATHWGAQHSLRQPLLWILHVGYAWVPIGLLLRALAGVVPSIPSSVATHALTVGAIGSLTIGMMARVTLGHTGRALVATKPLAWAFAATTAAACVRVVVPVVAPAWYPASLSVAGVLWTFAFIAYLAAAVPILTRPRADGKVG